MSFQLKITILVSLMYKKSTFFPDIIPLILIVFYKDAIKINELTARHHFKFIEDFKKSL